MVAHAAEIMSEDRTEVVVTADIRVALTEQVVEKEVGRELLRQVTLFSTTGVADSAPISEHATHLITSAWS